MFSLRRIWFIGAAALALLALLVSPLTGELIVGGEGDFQGDEAVEMLEVRIELNADGEDLDEPLGLDLGLGFPIWLQPLGRDEGVLAPFGAVPQQTTAMRTARAGADVSFTFYATATPEEAGNDLLQKTPKLLDGVLVSDISRVGFASRGLTAWGLSGYEVRINGKVFCSNDSAAANVADAQEMARARGGELQTEIEPLETEATDIRDLAQAGLATEEDTQRLTDIDEILVPLLKEQNRLERQLEGSYPWFVESGFRSAWRSEDGGIDDVQVTVVTAPHTGADTGNYIYYRTGGHKYLISSPVEPMSPDFGPQEFHLDLLAGPLTAADLRGHAVGMLAHEQPHGEPPDRWHPQRIIVAVDSRVVYDSDENPLDQMSLEAIRIIPPAHFDQEQEAVSNAPNARETFVWWAGQGLGLDLIEGGAQDLPPEDDEAFPEAEPGLEIEDETVVIEDEWYDPDFEPFPGEESFGPDWVPADDWYPDWEDDYWPDDDLAPWDPPPSYLDYIFGILEELIGQIDNELPDPFGEPIRIENVRFDGHLPNVSITWDVHGDETDVDHYLVEVYVVRPHEEPFVNAGSIWDTTVASGSREVPIPAAEGWAAVSGAIAGLGGAEQARLYVSPRVTPVLSTGAEEGQFGAARAIRRHNAIPLAPEPGAQVRFENTAFPPMNVAWSLAGPPPGEGRAAWFAGDITSHNGIVFENPFPGSNIVVRTLDQDDVVDFTLTTGVLPPDTLYHLALHAGFSGGSDAINDGRIQLSWDLRHPADPFVPDETLDWNELISPAGPPEPLVLLQNGDVFPIQTPAAPAERVLDVHITIERGALDPDHPPTIFGLRLIPD